MRVGLVVPRGQAQISKRHTTHLASKSIGKMCSSVITHVNRYQKGFGKVDMQPCRIREGSEQAFEIKKVSCISWKNE